MTVQCTCAGGGVTDAAQTAATGAGGLAAAAATVVILRSRQCRAGRGVPYSVRQHAIYP